MILMLFVMKNRVIFNSINKVNEITNEIKAYVVRRCEDVYNRTDESSVTFCERGGTV